MTEAATSAGSIDIGVLPSGHPFVRIGTGSRQVLSIPGLLFTAEPPSTRQANFQWKAWLPAIEEHDLTIWDIGRRGDFPTGTTAQDIADDYATVIEARFDGPVGVLGNSTGGAYALWLAIRHPSLVDRLVVGFTGPRLTAETRELQRRAATLMLHGRWRSGYALAGPLLSPGHPRVASGILWLLGPHALGRPRPLTVLPIDVDAEEGHDATAELGAIRSPTLVVSGGRDVAYPPSLVREMVAGIPGARHVEYPRAGHGGGGAPYAEEACAFLASGRVP